MCGLLRYLQGCECELRQGRKLLQQQEDNLQAHAEHAVRAFEEDLEHKRISPSTHSSIIRRAQQLLREGKWHEALHQIPVGCRTGLY